MKDNKLEQRIKNYHKTRQESNLRRRRETIDEFIMKKREKMMEKTDSKTKFEINVDDLKLPSEILNRDDGIIFFTELLSSSDINYIKFGILHVRKQLMLEVNPPIIEIVKNGFLSELLNKLDQFITDDTVVYEILWCFTNLTFGLESHEFTGFFLTPKAFRIFDRIFASGKPELVSSLLWLLNHIAADNENAREMMINSNIFQKMLEMLESESTNVTIMRHGIWLIASLSKGFSGEMNNKQMFERILNILCVYLRTDDTDITTDILIGLSNFSNTKFTFTLKVLIDRGIVSFIMGMDSSTSVQLIECALRIIGNLLTGDDLMTDEMIKYGVINLLERLMFHSFATIRREAAWSLSNIAAGTKGQIQAIAESNAFVKSLDLIRDPILDVAREAAWLISNCLSGADLNICFKLAAQGVIQGLIYLIVHHTEPTILAITLEGLNCIFQQGLIVSQFGNGRNPFVDSFINEGGVDFLEKLQEHKNDEIYTRTMSILEKYFPLEN